MKKILLVMLSALFLHSTAYADLKWVKYKGSIPKTAVKGGQEPGRNLYVCRAKFKKGIHPGKVVDGRCNIGWGGGEHSLANFEVLAGKAETEWVDVQGSDGPRFSAGMAVSNSGNGWSAKPIGGPGHQPSSDVWYGFIGGSEADGTPLAICNAKYYPGNRVTRIVKHSKGRHPGKIVSNNCNFGYGGKEIVWKHEFRILTVKGQYK